MKNRHSDIRCAALDCDLAAQDLDYGRQNLPGTKWRAALGALVSAPMRLHRYRNLHAEAIEDALRAFDYERRCEKHS
jgi:hypothetical protein